ncbi:MAG: tyrosine-protein phosphatase [Nocardioides sp.]|uniref:tyrosine-protein phosphatase n=1 Tax=Nocardioides sp. TaxID=35761 RepID=UPI0039E47ED4
MLTIFRPATTAAVLSALGLAGVCVAQPATAAPVQPIAHQVSTGNPGDPSHSGHSGHSGHPSQRGPIPFTAASLTEGDQDGSWIVTWKAPASVRTVKVYVGTSATSFARRPVLSHRHSGSLTVATTAARPWVELVGSTGAPLVIASRDLGLASDPNLRDIGGYRAADGQWVREGVVYRSQALSLTSADLAVVNTLGIAGDYDLRTTAEVDSSPDVVPTGATYRQLNVLGDDTSTSISATSAEEAVAYMEQAEIAMVDSDTAKAAYRELFTSLARERGASLYHCTAGKDRTGWATAALLTLLGVPDRTVMKDYLLSNTYYYESAAVQEMLAALPEAQREIYTPFMQVRASYLDAGLDRVEEEYGSMRNYFVEGLGLSHATIARLEDRLLVGRG